MATNPALNTIVSTINTLTRATYEQWCFKAKIELGGHLYALVTGEIDPPDEDDSAETLAAFEEANRNAMRILIPSIVEPEFQLVRNCDTAREIWQVLEANFKDVSMLRQCNTFEQLISLKYAPEKSIHDHISAFNKLYQEIKTYPNFKDLPDAIWVTRFLRSLPSDYAAFARSYDKELNTTKLNDVFGHLRSEYNNRTTTTTTTRSNDAAMPPTSANLASNNPSKKKNAKNGKGTGKPPAPSSVVTPTPGSGCDYCHKTNHTVENCYALKYKEFYERHNPPLYSKKNSKRNGTPPSVGTIATYESGYASAKRPALTKSPASAMLASSSNDIWIIDSGASDYMVPFPRSCFTDYSTNVPGHRIIHGISGGAKILGIGTIKLADQSGGELILNNVLHAPALPYALLSVGRLMQSGCTVTFENLHCTVTNASGFTIESKFAPSFGATSYLFRFRATFSVPAESHLATPNIPSDDQITLIHARLGHVATSTLFQVPKVSVIPDSWKSAISAVFNGDMPAVGACEPCLEGKQTRLPYPGTSDPTTAPLQLVHSDTCNVPVPSIKGYKDFVTFTDDWTRYSYAYPLANKEAATVLVAFKEFKAHIETHFGRTIKAIRMDGGSEYKASMREFLIDMGIDPQPSTHYSPESNGVSERLNRTLLDMARSMLFGANLPSNLWPEALSAALYIKNRLPHSKLWGITPYERFYGHQPSLSHLRIFGCAAHTHIPEARRNKSDSRSNHYHLIGFESEVIYKVWNPLNNEIFRARNVIFDETLFFQGPKISTDTPSMPATPPPHPVLSLAVSCCSRLYYCRTRTPNGSCNSSCLSQSNRIPGFYPTFIETIYS